ncbi:MAG: hypothetical protein ACOYZ6_06425 [Chloroflexota bacterium]
MNNLSRLILIFCLVIVAVHASGCGAVTAVPSATETPVPSRMATETATVTPSPTNTPKPIHPEGTLIYSDYKAIYSIDLGTHIVNIISETNGVQRDLLIVKDKMYFLRSTQKYESGFSGNQEVFQANLDGTNLTQLTFGADKYAGKYFLAVSPDNRFVAYRQDGNPPTLVVLDLKNRTSKVIAKKDGHSYYHLSWSFDSEKLLFFDMEVMKAYEYGRLLLYSIDDQKITELLLDTNMAIWSPDGKNIITSKDQTSAGGFYILNVNNSEFTQITSDDSAGNFFWSSDGKRILFTIESGNQEELYSYNVESSHLEQLALFPNGRSAFGLIWSPNEKAFLYLQSEHKSIDNSLNLFDLTSKNSTDISYQDGAYAGANYWNWQYFPTWSPDGKFITYITQADSDFFSDKVVLNVLDILTGGHLEFEIPRNDQINSFYWILQ